VRGIGSSELQKRKFQAALPNSQINNSKVPATSESAIQSATGENLTEAAQIANRWKGYCEDLYHMTKNGKELNKNIGSKSFHHFVYLKFSSAIAEPIDGKMARWQ